MPPLSVSESTSTYRTKAEQVARRVRDVWGASGSSDLKALVDEVQVALSEEANHELRQVLFTIAAGLEMGMVKGEEGNVTLDRRGAERILNAVSRATAIVDTHLDRSEAAKLILDLEPESFDIGTQFHEMMHWNGFLEHPEEMVVAIEPVTIEADRERVLDVLSHMATRFWFGRNPGQCMRLTMRDQGENVEGFVGLIESHIGAEELMAEFDKPLTVEEMEIDTPYTRAVIERHGGTLFVSAEEGASGFGWTLPKRLPAAAHHTHSHPNAPPKAPEA